MLNNAGKTLSVLVLVVGLAALALGGFFIQQGFSRAQDITDKMIEANITYGGAGGDIIGIIDTPVEARVMADILTEHSQEIGNYSEMSRDDPNRQTVLNALTMTNSLQMAVMGYGLTDVVKAVGGFMVLAGLAFGAIAVQGLRQRKPGI